MVRTDDEGQFITYIVARFGLSDITERTEVALILLDINGLESAMICVNRNRNGGEMDNTTDGNTQYALGERVHYKHYGIGVVRERVETENGVKYLIEFERVMAWMAPNYLLKRAEVTECSKG